MPKISVVVPVYGVQAYLGDCLKSLLSQTFQDIEIICVDDASPDLCPAILRKFASVDKRIKIITHSENKGVSCARNNGVAAATGKYIHFVDSDDMLKFDCYSNMWDLVSAHNFPELAIYEWKTQYNMFSKSLEGMVALESPADKVKILGAPYPVYKFSRTDFVRQFMFQPGNKGADDVPWSWMIVVSAKFIPICHKKFYYYRQVASSLTHDRNMIKNKHLCVSYAITKQWLMHNGYWDEPIYQNRFKSIVTSARKGIMLKHGTKEEIDALFKEYPILSDKEDTTNYLEYMKSLM